LPHHPAHAGPLALGVAFSGDLHLLEMPGPTIVAKPVSLNDWLKSGYFG